MEVFDLRNWKFDMPENTKESKQVTEAQNGG